METFGRGPGGVRRPAPNRPTTHGDLRSRPGRGQETRAQQATNAWRPSVEARAGSGDPRPTSQQRMETFGRGPGGVRRPAPNNRPAMESFGRGPGRGQETRAQQAPNNGDLRSGAGAGSGDPRPTSHQRMETFGRGPGGVRRPAPNKPPTHGDRRSRPGRGQETRAQQANNAWRPSVEARAGSGDPRPTISQSKIDGSPGAHRLHEDRERLRAGRYHQDGQVRPVNLATSSVGHCGLCIDQPHVSAWAQRLSFC